jgi:hypothetical protein
MGKVTRTMTGRKIAKKRAEVRRPARRDPVRKAAVTEALRASFYLVSWSSKE